MNAKTIRLNRIMELLHEESPLTTKALSAALGVSDMTIRRDVRELSDRGLVEAYYGGIALSSDSSAPQAMSQSQRDNYLTESAHVREKDAIARYASQLIEARDAVAIDNGTTCSQIPMFMDPEIPNIIYTYSYMVLEKIIRLQNENWRLFALGGYYHPGIQMFENEDVIHTIKKIHINKLFLGASGVSEKYGLSCVQPFEISIRRALIEISDTVILLADSSKLGKSWFDHYGQLEEMDILITDSGITKEQRDALEATGIDLRVV